MDPCPREHSQHIPSISIHHRAEETLTGAWTDKQEGWEGGRKLENKRAETEGEQGEERMDALIPVLKNNPGPSVLVFSLLFRVVHRLLQNIPVPKVVKQNDLHSWKWRNLSVSMVHSLLTGTWALTW